jgi:hypothetical protein
MARKIKDTPVLYGRDAKIFSKKANENIVERASEEELKRIMANYKSFKVN